jgi:hypothetical protein
LKEYLSKSCECNEKHPDASSHYTTPNIVRTCIGVFLIDAVPPCSK